MQNPYPVPKPIHPLATPNHRGRRPVGFFRQVSGGIGLGLVLLMVSLMGFSLDSRALTNLLPESYNLSAIVEGGVYFLGFGLAYLAIQALSDLPWDRALPWAGVEPSLATAAVSCGLLCSFGGAMTTQFLNTLVAQITGFEATMPDLPTPDSALGWLIYFVSVALLPALLEEMVFRGAVLQSLRQFGDSFAIVMSAILFSLSHGNLVQGPNSFVMGLFLAALVVYTGSIKIGMLLHFCNNFFFSLIGAADEVLGGLPASSYGLLVAGLLVWGTSGLFRLLREHPDIFSPGRSDYSVGLAGRVLHFFTAPMMLLYLLICGGLIFLSFVPMGA